MSKIASTNQNISVRENHFNMLRLLRRVYSIVAKIMY